MGTLVPAVLDKFRPVVVPSHGADLELLPSQKQTDEVTPAFFLSRHRLTGDVTWVAKSRAVDSDLNYLKAHNVNFLKLQSNRNITVEAIKTAATFPMIRLHLRETMLGDDIIPYINQMKNLQAIDVRTTHITNAGILNLAPSKSLRELNLCDLKTVSDSGLAHLVKSFPNLTNLGLSGTKVTGKGLKQLKPLKLSSLALADLKLTDADMETIAILGPRIISVESNPITDKGIDKLLKIPVITSLSVEFCKEVSLKKLEEFKRKYPGIEIRVPFPEREQINNTL